MAPYRLLSSCNWVVQLMRPFDEKEVGHLIDGGEGVCYRAGPEAIPDGVDFGF